MTTIIGKGLEHEIAIRRPRRYFREPESLPENISSSNGTARYITQYSKNFQTFTNLLSVGMNLAYNSMNPENKPE